MINPNTIDVVTLVFIIFQFDFDWRTNKYFRGANRANFPFQIFRFYFVRTHTKPHNETIFTFSESRMHCVDKYEKHFHLILFIFFRKFLAMHL